MNDQAFKPTEEQEYILEQVRSTPNNLSIRALAGSGKSSTLRLIGRERPGVLLIAFNKRIVDASAFVTEREWRNMDADTRKETYALERASRMGPQDMVRTSHSICLEACKSIVGGKLSVDGKKINSILKIEIEKLRDRKVQEEAWDAWQEITQAVGMAQAYGYVPQGDVLDTKALEGSEAFWDQLDETPDDLVRDLTNACLIAGIKASFRGTVDFNDMLYLPAICGGTFPRVEDVLVDEAQDFSPVQWEMVWRMLKHSRIMACGDDNQSIYAFRGAMPGGMAAAAKRFNMFETDLSICFRCPENIVRNVHWRTPHMKWTKSGGIVGNLRNPTVDMFADGSAVVCRNNAPLLNIAFKLLANGRNVNLSGSDIGARIVTLLRKLGPEEMTKTQLEMAIENWRQEKLAKQSKSADDLADCMMIFADKGEDLGQAIAYAQKLFEQSGPLTLITGHKAKGLEWDKVYHLDPWLIKDQNGEQEWNLRYVIQTRSLGEYYEVNSEEIQFE